MTHVSDWSPAFRCVRSRQILRAYGLKRNAILELRVPVSAKFAVLTARSIIRSYNYAFPFPAANAVHKAQS